MTEEHSRNKREDQTDLLFGIFGGFNEAYATAIVEGDDGVQRDGAVQTVETDFEYRGILLDPDFEISFDPDSFASTESLNGDTDADAVPDGEDAESDVDPLVEDGFDNDGVTTPSIEVEDHAPVAPDAEHDGPDEEETSERVEPALDSQTDPQSQERDEIESSDDLVTDSQTEIFEDDLDTETEVAPVEIADEIPTDETVEDAPQFAAAEPVVPVDQIVRVERLIAAIREDGHHASDIDPLGLMPRTDKHLLPEAFGIRPETLDASSSFLTDAHDELLLWLAKPSIGEALNELKSFYCGTIGYEFDHIHNVEERLWLQDQVENQVPTQFMTDSQKRYQLELLTKVEGFEKFLHTTFPGKRWYGLEGLDALIPLIDQIILHSAFNVKQIVMGMAHRGRLNALAHLLEQPYESLFTGFLEGRFAHLAAMEAAGWMTDVKYHLGSRADVDVDQDGSTDIQIRLLPNPSHLEMVDAVVLGAVRAEQDEVEDGADPHMEAMALLIHGDAAFAGQGIVAESLNLVNLDGYSVGGAIHVIANNQLGFTTQPNEGFSGQYCSDIARGYEIPVVHVNAEDLEACALVAKMAVSYRLKFRKEFVIDLIGYRRHGHNENDEPRFTQPIIYSKLESHPTLREQWAKRLIDEEVISLDEDQSYLKTNAEKLNDAMRRVNDSGAGTKRQEPADLGLAPEPMHGEKFAETSVDRQRILDLNDQLCAVPNDFELHPTIARVFSRRAQVVANDERGIDWSHAEALAIGSVMQDGIAVRLTGQDSARGTFSQRHAVVWENTTGRTHCPLQHVEGGSFSIFNSPLSEAGPVGFEHGYSVFSDSCLVLWEAQFGDFVNNAQAIIDEMVVSAREKWGQRSNLVLLLPHGYEGQGPNHSHAHLERFLDLASSGNMRIANPTTSAQYFHLLRTQAALLAEPDRARPLVVMTPKSLLRHPMSASSVDDLANGTFRPIRKFALSKSDPENIKRIVLCSGKVFVDLATHPKISEVDDIGIIVLEELYPFPEELLIEAFKSFKNYEDVVWLQEEPRNRGAWDFVRTPIASIAKTGLRYIGRPRSPSPASGSNWLHRRQQDRLIRIALKLEQDD